MSPGCPPVEAGEPDVDQRGGPATAFRRGPCLALVPAGGARGCGWPRPESGDVKLYICLYNYIYIPVYICIKISISCQWQTVQPIPTLGVHSDRSILS